MLLVLRSVAVASDGSDGSDSSGRSGSTTLIRGGVRHGFTNGTACERAFGAFAHHPLALRTAEDAVASRLAPRPDRVLRQQYGVCPLMFGRTLNYHRGRGGVFWVEVPKAGSSTLRKMLSPISISLARERALAHKHGPRWLQLPSPRSFAVVREPLARLISAYYEIVGRLEPYRNHARAHLLPRFVFATTDSVRFSSFVDFLLSHGDGPLLEARGPTETIVNAAGYPVWPCDWMHAMTQVWHLTLYPGPIECIAHLENLDESIEVLKQRLRLARFLNPRSDDSQTGSRARARVGDKSSRAATSHVGGADSTSSATLRLNSNSRSHLLYQEVRSRSTQHGAHAKGGSGLLNISSRLMQYLKQDYACLGYDGAPAGADV